jgi:hypothetical protein
MKSLSASSLAEYMSASPSRRTAILRNAINPPVFIVDRYGITYKASAQALCSASVEPIDRAKQLVKSVRPKSIQQGQRIENTLQSLEHAGHVLPFLIDGKSKFATAKASPKYLEVGGIEIKVLPQALIIDQYDKVRGTIRIHCSKGFRVNGEIAQDYATVLFWYAEQNYGNSTAIDPAKCTVVDIFAETFSIAPKTTIRRKKKIQDTCEEISDRWDALAQRLYNGRGFERASG